MVVAHAPYKAESSPADISARELFPAAVGPQTTSALLFSSGHFPGLSDTRSPRPASVAGPPVRPRRGHAGPPILSSMSRSPRLGSGRHVHGVPAPGFADGPSVPVLCVPDVDLLRRADLALVSLEGVLLDGPQNLQKSSLGHPLGHRSWRLRQSRRLGPASRGKLKDVGRVEGAILDEPQGLFVILLGLPRMTDDYIRGEGPLRHGLPKHLDLAAVPVRFVSPMHGL